MIHLPSLLVQEGLVSVPDMVTAIGQMAASGGALDTVLLEMGLGEVDKLRQAIAQATDWPMGELPAPLDQAEVPALRALVSANQSREFGVLPMARKDSTLIVWVTAETSPKRLRALEKKLKLSLAPKVVLAHEFALQAARLYDQPADDRFLALAPAPLAAPAVFPRTEPAIAIVAMPPSESGSGEYDVVMEALPSEDLSSPGHQVKQAAGEITTPVAGAPSGPAIDVTLAVEEAGTAIESAKSRDEIFSLLCRGARSKLTYAALLTVQGGSLHARLALGKRWLPHEMLAPLVMEPGDSAPLRAAVELRAPYLGRLGDDGATHKLLRGLGRKAPTLGLLLPIVLRGRTVAVLYGDASGATLEGDVLASLSTLAAAATRAFQRLILDSKADKKGHEGKETAAPNLAAGADDEAVAIPTEASTPAGASAPLRSSKKKSGRISLEATAENSTAPDDNGLTTLFQSLFTAPSDERDQALRTIRQLERNSSQSILEMLRRELRGTETDRARKRQAVAALGALRDSGAVLLLIDALKDEAQLSKAALQALVEVTKQNFGSSRWRWHAWWERHQNEPRLEWIFEGLRHADTAVRQSAAEELRALSGQDFDYRVDSPRAEREEARQNWMRWMRSQRPAPPSPMGSERHEI